MTHLHYRPLLFILTLFLTLAGQAQTVLLTSNALKGTTYHNPIIKEDLPDPSIIRADNGYFYLYATGEKVWKSKDMINWQYVGFTFNRADHPTFVDGVDWYWAPDINKINDQYVLYFSLSLWGGGKTAGIGVATSKTPEGPFKPVGDGKLFVGSELGVENSIDQFYIEDGGKKYIIWGSFNGIYAIELSDDGLSLKPGAEKVRIGGTHFEGSYIYKRGNYYYYFGSINNCCDGADSRYTTVYARSTSLLGPYYNKTGGRLLDNNYEVLIQGNDRFVGTGHNAEFLEDKNGDTWITYHAYIKKEPERGRVVMLDRVLWKNDWPYVVGNQPSDEAPIPQW